MELDRSDASFSFYLGQQLLLGDVVEGPTAIIRADNHVVTHRLERETRYILVAFNSEKRLARLQINHTRFFTSREDLIRLRR